MIENRQHIRSFIAIQLPDSVKSTLADLQGKISNLGITASFPNPETFHLTLKFLGNIFPDDLDAVEKCLKKSVQGVLPHTLFTSGIGAFPSVKHPRIIWSGIRGETDRLEALAAGLDSVLFKDMGIKKEEKRFTPHLTLARMKQRVLPNTIIKLIKDFQNFRTPDFSVSGIGLFQSTLTSFGAIHKMIAFEPFQY